MLFFTICVIAGNTIIRILFKINNLNIKQNIVFLEPKLNYLNITTNELNRLPVPSFKLSI